MRLQQRCWWHLGLGVVLLLSVVAAPGSVRAAETLIIEISGIDGAERENVQQSLQLPAGLLARDRLNERWLRRFQGQVPELVAKALEPFGYYHSETTTELSNGPDRNPRLQIQVDAGPPVRISRVDIDLAGPGSRLDEVRRLRAAFPLQSGQQLYHAPYIEWKTDLRRALLDAGYLKADYLTSQIRVNHQTNLAEIELKLDSGLQFFFGPTEVAEDAGFPVKFLNRFLEYSPGEVYSDSRLDRARFNFRKSDRFDDVHLLPDLEQAENQRVPIKVELQPAPRYRFRPGVGYRTDSGLRGSLNFQDRNVWQRGHRLEAELTYAARKSYLEFNYLIPTGTHFNDNWIGSSGFQVESITAYDTTILFAELERTYDIGEEKIASWFLRTHQENYTIAAADGSASLIIPGLRLIYRDFDDPVNPKEGFQYRTELLGSWSETLGQSTMLQANFVGTLLQPLSDLWTLQLRANFGVIEHEGGIDEVPASMRYFVGGDNSVRGYPYKSRGAVDEGGRLTGGDRLVGGSFELGRKFTENWGGALFFDAGSAFLRNEQIRFVKGAGFGLRRYTPAGPLGIDLARQIGEENPSWRLHLSVGFEL